MKKKWHDLLVFLGNVKKYATPSRWDIQGSSSHYDCAWCHQEWWFDLDGHRPVVTCCPDARRFALCDLSTEELAKPPAPTLVEAVEREGIEVLHSDDNWISIVKFPHS